MKLINMIVAYVGIWLKLADVLQNKTTNNINTKEKDFHFQPDFNADTGCVLVH